MSLIINESELPDDEVKKMMGEYIKSKYSISVIYNPDCGCKIDQFVVLDRYPMSPKIQCQCPMCLKGCIMNISDPIVFHSELTNEDFTSKDLVNSFITDTWQKEHLLRYQRQFIRNIDKPNPPQNL